MKTLPSWEATTPKHLKQTVLEHHCGIALVLISDKKATELVLVFWLGMGYRGAVYFTYVRCYTLLFNDFVAIFLSLFKRSDIVVQRRMCYVAVGCFWTVVC